MKIQIVENEQLNGIELYFDEKPNAEKIDKLKSLGYRFHRGKACWYIKAKNHQKNIVEIMEAEEGVGVTIKEVIEKASREAYKVAESKIEELEGQVNHIITDGGGQVVGSLPDLCGGAWAKFVANTPKNRSLVKYIKAHGKNQGFSDTWVFETEAGSLRMGKGYPSGFTLSPSLPMTQMKTPTTQGIGAFVNAMNNEGFDMYTYSYLD